MTRWPSKRRIRAKRFPQNGGADVPDVHRLGHVGRTEVNNNGAGPGRLFKKQVPLLRRLAQRPGQGRGLEAKVQETRAGHLHRLAPVGDVQPARHCPRPIGADSFCAPWPAPSARCFGNRRTSDRGTDAPGRAPASASGNTARRACWSFCSRILWSTVAIARRPGYFGAEYFLMISNMAPASGACSSSWRNSLS